MDPKSGTIKDESEMTAQEKKDWIKIPQREIAKVKKMSLIERIQWGIRKQKIKDKNRKRRAMR